MGQQLACEATITNNADQMKEVPSKKILNQIMLDRCAKQEELFGRSVRIRDLRTLKTLLASGVAADTRIVEAACTPAEYFGFKATAPLQAMRRGEGELRQFPPALFVVLQRRDKEMAELLLAHGASPETRCWGLTALQAAAWLRAPQLTQLLLGAGALTEAATPWGGLTALHLALAVGDEESAQLLLERGANPNAADAHGTRPLHYAAERGCYESVARLLDRGAPVDQEDKTGSTPLLKVLLFALSKSFQVRDAQDPKELRKAVRRSYSDLVRLLVAHGADVHQGAGLHGNSLHAACSPSWRHSPAGPGRSCKVTAQMRVVRLLLATGAAVNARSSATGEGPLHAAAQGGAVALVRLLLDQGAAVDACDFRGRRPLHQASFIANPAVARLLLARGAHVDAPDADGASPLLLATREAAQGRSPAERARRRELVNLLLMAGATAFGPVQRSPFEACAYGAQDTRLLQQLMREEPPDLGERIAQLCWLRLRCPDLERILIVQLVCTAPALEPVALGLTPSQTELYVRCLREAAAMKLDHLHAGVSLFDLLSRPRAALPALARNRRLLRAFEVCRYRERFPLLAESLAERMGAARRTVRLARAALRTLRRILPRVLPHLVLERLLAFLDDRALKALERL